MLNPFTGRNSSSLVNGKNCGESFGSCFTKAFNVGTQYAKVFKREQFNSVFTMDTCGIENSFIFYDFQKDVLEISMAMYGDEFAFAGGF